jgi:hypothetical protein
MRFERAVQRLNVHVVEIDEQFFLLLGQNFLDLNLEAIDPSRLSGS